MAGENNTTQDKYMGEQNELFWQELKLKWVNYQVIVAKSYICYLVLQKLEKFKLG